MKLKYYILAILFTGISALIPTVTSAQSNNGLTSMFSNGDNKAKKKYPNQLSADRMERGEKKAFRARFDGERVSGQKYTGMGKPVSSPNDNFTKSRGYYSERTAKKINKDKQKAAGADDKSAVAAE